MAYENLKQEIQDNIKTNGEGAITGQILQDTLLDMVDNYPVLEGFTLLSSQVYTYGNLPAVPTDGKKYFIIVRRQEIGRFRRYIYTSSPDESNGQWMQSITIADIRLYVNESAYSDGAMPDTYSKEKTDDVIRQAVREVSLSYATAGDFTIEQLEANANNQVSGDIQYIDDLADSSCLFVTMQISNFNDGATYYVTSRRYASAADWEINFGTDSNGIQFYYDGSEYHLIERT